MDADGPHGYPVFQELRCADCGFGWILHWLDTFNLAIFGDEIPVRPIPDMVVSSG
jgi:hypothetical protein